jgi:O-antigen/teichoic acid export membrane protein
MPFGAAVVAGRQERRTLKASLRWNALANLAGRAWNAILSIVLVPVLVDLLGTDAYGIVGLVSTFAVVFAFLDLGLATTVNRELARFAALSDDSGGQRDLVRTFESVYWATGVIVGLGLAATADWVAREWIVSDKLPIVVVRDSVAIIGASFAARWPIALYTGVLQGLERQVLQNGISILAATVRGVGGAVVVWLVDRTVTSFLIWQLVCNIGEAVLFAAAAWLSLPKGSRWPRFRWRMVKRLWRFALAFNLVGIVGMVVSQFDRVVISGALPIATLGFYSVVSTAAGGTALISSAVCGAAFPRFTKAFVQRAHGELMRQYLLVNRVVAIASCSVGLTLAFFPGDILAVWTRSSVIVAAGQWPLRVLGVASLVNGLVGASYSLLIAAGEVRAILAVNVAAGGIAIPLMLLCIPRYGLVAAAAIWLLQNLWFFFAYQMLVTRRVLKEFAWWDVVGRDTCYMVGSALLVIGTARVGTFLVGASATGTVGVAAGAFGLFIVGAGLKHPELLPAGLRRQ